jgi:putative flippase GtrA
MEAARFFAVAVAGLALDLGVAWFAARLMGLPLWLAATLGFIVAAVVNYALHELWTFRDGARRLSGGRALRYGAALAATLGARVATVAALAALVGNSHALPVLLAGAGVSFFVNYMISKHFVFRPESRARDSAP